MSLWQLYLRNRPALVVRFMREIRKKACHAGHYAMQNSGDWCGELDYFLQQLECEEAIRNG